MRIKNVNTIFLLLFVLMISCKNQKAISKVTCEELNTVLVIKKVTSQISYPGVSDGSNSYSQRWMFQLEKLTGSNGSVSLLLKGRKIKIGDLQAKGIVIADDDSEVFLTVVVKYPIESNYPKNEFDSMETPHLLVEIEGERHLIVLDNVIVLEEIIYPSNTN